MQPILLAPAFKDYLWGGTKLKTQYGKQSDLDIVAESWELSTHKDGQSTVASGSDRGLSLTEYIEKHGEAVLGSHGAAFDFFPILIKLIDARDNLSIQVHPDDDYALKNEGEYGKTEMWYILEAEEGASLYYGLNTEVSKEEFRRRIESNTLLEVLNRVEVHKGDVFFIQAGTVHAIGKGIVICEIQQNSNTTYRVYDYDRRDAQGNPRQLHIEQAIQVSDLKPAPENTSAGEEVSHEGYTQKQLASCRYFTVERLYIASRAELNITAESFHSLVVTEGSGTLAMEGTELSFKKGDSILIPAQEQKYTITGNCEVIRSYV